MTEKKTTKSTSKSGAVPTKKTAAVPAKKAPAAPVKKGVTAPEKKATAAPAKKAAAAPVKKAATAPAKKATTLRTVEFGCYSPASGIVEVAGDFNGWVPAKNPMTKSSDGFWSVKIKLQPGRYTYKFVYDGVAWELDRQAPAMADLDGHLNSVIDVV